MKRNNINIIIALFLVLVIVSARIVNAKLSLPNFVPIAAIGMFSGVILKDNRALAFLIPMLGQFLADVCFQFFTDVPGFYGVTGQSFTYLAILSTTAVGTFVNQPKPIRVLGFTIGASLVFFLVSNFGFFVDGWNGHSIAGLSKTYIDALPFYKNSFLSDMMGSALLFGGYFITQQALLKNAEKVKA